MAFAWVFVVALAMVALGVVDARAQVLPGVDAVIYAVTYVEVMPTSRADGVAALRRYRDATRGEEGNLRCESASRLGQPHQLVILEAWKDQKAFEAHGKSPSAAQMRVTRSAGASACTNTGQPLKSMVRMSRASLG